MNSAVSDVQQHYMSLSWWWRTVFVFCIMPIVLYTKLDAECDQQVTVKSRSCEKASECSNIFLEIPEFPYKIVW